MIRLGLPTMAHQPGVLGIAAMVIFPTVLSGQSLVGRVIDFATADPVATAEVGLLGDTGTQPLRVAIADSAGQFVIGDVAAGTYRLRVRRIGYLEVTTPEFSVMPGEPTRVEITASPDAIPLAPLMVVAGPPRNSIRLVGSGFYEREAAWGRNGLGMGHFLGPAQLREMSRASRVSDYLRGLAGVYVGGGTGRKQVVEMRSTTSILRNRCTPSIYLDGQLIRFADSVDDVVSAMDVSAIEVYPGGTNKPAQFSHMQDDLCGSVVIWTGGR